MHHVLAIDQGTSGTKAIVVDESGRVVSIAEVAVRPEYLPGGGVEQDPEALFDSVVDAGRQALAQADVPVVAVALANQGETVLAWDRDTGRPLTPAVVWQDRRAEAICAPLSASADAVARRHRAGARPVFLRAEDGLDPGEHDRGGRGHHHRYLAGAPVVRGVRHRRLDGQQVAVDRAGLGHMGRRASRPVRADRRSASRDRGQRPDRRQHRCFRADDSGRRAHRRPASRTAGRKLPDARRRQVHLRYGCIPAGAARRQRRHDRRRG